MKMKTLSLLPPNLSKHDGESIENTELLHAGQLVHGGPQVERREYPGQHRIPDL